MTQNGTNNTKILPVILCGGSGTRLWPLSRKSLPKQFVPLIGGKSLLQATFERVAGLSVINPSGQWRARIIDFSCAMRPMQLVSLTKVFSSLLGGIPLRQ